MKRRLAAILSFLAIATQGDPAAALNQVAPAPQEQDQAAGEAAEPVPSGPATPADLFRRFFEHMNRYQDTKDSDALHRAGRLFEMDDVLKGDQEYVGDQAARDLLNFLDRALFPFRPELVATPEPDQTEMVHRVAYKADGQVRTAELHLVRDPAFGWKFSSRTRKAVRDLYQQVRDQKPRHGKGGVQDATTWLRDHVPEALHRRFFLLDHWQWLGLFALILLGVLASVVARLLTTAIRAHILQRRGIEPETRGWRRSRPFGVMAMAAVWYFGLAYLILPEIVFAALMLAARFVLMVGTTWAVCSLIDYGAEFFSAMASRTRTRVDDVIVPMVQRVLKIFVVVMGVVWIADALDINIKALLAGLGIGGVALALAAKDTVENFFGAVSILADRPFEVGDWVVLDGVEGTVESVGFRSTRIRTFYNSLVTVPNALLTRAKVDNFGARQYRRLKATLEITYDTPPDRIESFCEGVRELIRRHPYTRKDYYHVYFNGYGESGLQILLYMFFITPDWATELREKHRLLLDILRLAGELDVEFAFPTRTLHMIQEEKGSPRQPLGSVEDARRKAQQLAREIVRQFTGERKPPPVQLASDARDDSSGEG